MFNFATAVKTAPVNPLYHAKSEGGDTMPDSWNTQGIYTTDRYIAWSQGQLID